MKRQFLLLAVALCGVLPAIAQITIDKSTLCPSFAVNGKTMITTPPEGLWAVSTLWDDDWIDRKSVV